MGRVIRFNALVLTIAVSLLTSSIALADATGMNVHLVPSASTVAVGSEFELRVRLVDQGLEFNTYGIALAYDPQALKYVEVTPISLQEGAYMTQACGSTFHSFTPEPTDVRISHSLLCFQTFLTGPGDLYVLRFKALEPGAAQITFADVRFYRAGYPVTIQQAVATTIQVVDSPSDGELPRADRLRLAIAPNPFNPTTVVSIDAPAAGWQRLAVYDLRGRLVRDLGAGTYPAGVRRITWTAIDTQGNRVSSGVYVFKLETAAGTRTTRAVLLQ